ncbi:MAG: hypothetical protein WA802_08765 [Terracidiphilus sp.]
MNPLLRDSERTHEQFLPDYKSLRVWEWTGMQGLNLRLHGVTQAENNRWGESPSRV